MPKAWTCLEAKESTWNFSRLGMLVAIIMLRRRKHQPVLEKKLVILIVPLATVLQYQKHPTRSKAKNLLGKPLQTAIL